MKTDYRGRLKSNEKIGMSNVKTEKKRTAGPVLINLMNAKSKKKFDEKIFWKIAKYITL
ncbi:hypothetical protein [Alkalicoccus halolimnae]|uniref:Uncharacterized protein n=1 Tax=Alkalicoccus halolimnae TaxID=1667239 RepID=A0AAJ8LY45_9BACI